MFSVSLTWSDENFLDTLALGELPGEGVLPPACAYDEDAQRRLRCS